MIFAQFPKVANSNVEDSTSATDSPSDSPNYTELGDGQVMDILKMHIGDLNSGDGLVLFKGAIEHAARICRAMVLTYSVHIVYTLTLMYVCIEFGWISCNAHWH